MLAIVGKGRVGGVLARTLRAKGVAVRLYGRDSRPDRFFYEARCVLLAVPDSEIAAAARERCGGLRRSQVVAHCSGAAGLEPLAEAGEAHRGSLHPFCSIPSKRATLPRAVAAIDGDAIARRALARIARLAGLSPVHVEPELRPLYHAAAVLASNGLFALAAGGSELLARAGVPEHERLRALVPLMRSALDGIEREELPRAATGPVARGDAATVEAHLDAFRANRLQSVDRLYRVLSEALVPISRALGQATDAELSAIAVALRGR